ncbi:MAG: anhydro-N-acetylmuramic acid kinase [Geothrix sp.]|uniref:anhydro-N-acetylmuramic acid kinase n=1 Tax=Geothrix sp. TaxID=1962974 RepID=UPI0017FDB0B7|nr:anhydro-N-acetylmuramic acid kinase [Geothrix sp.]NWJ40136.1 anhydro-N-acetylmuramic acid kinase [Geothrix sp.]WIL21855.1 MAG: anhydro-N-acetylmuramic acid kinase [Geothrix sp.]
MQPRIPIPADRPWRVLGLMSGTSADGVDAVAIEVDPGAFEAGRPFRRLLGHMALPYSRELHEEVLDAASNRLDPAGLCILQRRLGDHHAKAAGQLCGTLGIHPDLASLHGQTVQHHPEHGASLQLADPYVLVEALGCPVVWDLRRRDLAVGGQGAPLVPLPERWLHGPGPWLALNLGGIANLTVWDGKSTRAWDTGPGMSLLDLAAKLWLDLPFDPDGIHATGTVAMPLLSRWLAHPYFQAAPPKSTGREVFGAAWFEAERHLLEPLPLSDRLATLAAFSAATIAVEATRSRPWPAGMRGLVSGGGARHRRLRAELDGRLQLTLGDDLAFPSGAREAVSWALLGAASAMGLPGHLPEVTGASRSRVLGSWVWP